MGISSNGQLSFGIPIGEEEEPLEFMGDFEDFEDFVEHELGLPEWREGMSDEESSEHWKRKRDALATYPVTLESYCSYDYPMYLLLPNVDEASMMVRRGYLASFDELPKIDGDAVDAMQEWCKTHDIEWIDPRWHLSSMYG